MDELKLTKSQKKVFKAYKQGKNIFMTGKGGTGKSFITKYIIDDARQDGKEVIVCAPTGIAAINVGGATIHSVFHPGKGIIEMDAKCHDKKKLEILKNVDLLVIDEISMCRADLFRFICNTLKHINNDDLQLFIVGDFFQLPPVLTEEEGETFRTIWGNSLYAFETDVWQDLGLVTIELTEVKRQTDLDFIRCLDAIREGNPQFDVLKSRCDGDPDPEAITLCGTNSEAAAINEKKIHNLVQTGSKNFRYKATTTGFPGENKSVFPAPENLWLCEGAHVIMLNNDKDYRWVNGTMATVEKLTDDSITIRLPEGGTANVDKSKWEVLEYYVQETELPNGTKKKKVLSRIKASMEQFPLKLAWAISIHKSQGQTFDRVNIDISRIFTSGQLYVALSRCRSLEGLHITGKLTKDKVIVCDAVKLFMSGQYEFKGYRDYQRGLEDGQKGLPSPKGEDSKSEEYQRGWKDGYETREKELKELEDKEKKEKKKESDNLPVGDTQSSPLTLKQAADSMSSDQLKEAGLRRISQRQIKEREKSGMAPEERNPRGAGRKPIGHETKIIRIPKPCAESIKGLADLYWAHPELVQQSLDQFMSKLVIQVKKEEKAIKIREDEKRRQGTLPFDKLQ